MTDTGVQATQVEPDLQKRLIELHKGHGPGGVQTVAAHHGGRPALRCPRRALAGAVRRRAMAANGNRNRRRAIGGSWVGPFSSESAMATPLPRPRRRNSGRIGYCRRPRARGACIRRDRPDRPASRGPNQRRDRHHRRLEGAILQGEQDPSRCGQGVDVRTARIRFRRHTAREANALGRGNREGAHRAICLRAGEVDRPVGHLGARAGLINTANHRWCRAHHGKNNSRTISTFSGLAEIAAHTSNTVAVHHVDDSRAFADPGTVERCRQSLQGRRSFVRPANQKNHPFPNTPRPL